MTAESSSVAQTPTESVAQKMGFFRVPDLLVKLSTKCLIELDAVRSPTSPLDLKFFTGLGAKSPRSPSVDGSQSRKVGLGLVDSLSDDNPAPLGSRKVLLGSEMRITDNLTRKSDSMALVQSEELEQKDENYTSDGLIGSIMSLDDIVNSEDYTCVVSRGPNPRTTHIFGDRVFESGVERLIPDENKGEEIMPPLEKEGVMSFCCFCRERLKEGKDIYIYQGDKAFCSTECRENFMEDEMEGGPVTYHPAPPSDTLFDEGRVFQLIC